MSPGTGAGEPLDARTDVWTLGVVLYEMARAAAIQGGTRQPPSTPSSTSEPDSIGDPTRGCRSSFDRIIRKALEKDRELRYQTASDFRADLRRLLREIDSSSSLASGVKYRRRAAARSRAAGSSPDRLAALAARRSPASSRWRFFKMRRRARLVARQHLQLTDRPAPNFSRASRRTARFRLRQRADGNYDIYLQRVGGKNPKPDQTRPPTKRSPPFRPTASASRSARNASRGHLRDGRDGRKRAPRRRQRLSPVLVAGRQGNRLQSKRVVTSPTCGTAKPSAFWIVNVEIGGKATCYRDGRDAARLVAHGERIAYWFIPPSGPERHRDDLQRRRRARHHHHGCLDNWNPVWSPDGKLSLFRQRPQRQHEFLARRGQRRDRRVCQSRRPSSRRRNSAATSIFARRQGG